ncbi:TPA: PBSX family phage terminase large subunit [Patescibacteria group bacterium]|nr:PBSX family phage terminase large subunit [Patescibacteria group bacterium]
MEMLIPTEFKRLLDTDWREASVHGGRFSLKSHTVARILLIRARQKKIRVLCCREMQNSIADSSHQLLSDLIRQYNLTDFKVTDKSIINSINGSDFLFKGLHRNEQSIKSTEGVDIAWVEEAQTITTSSLEILTPTVRKEGSQIVYTYNRLEEADPVHNRLVIEGRPNTIVINVNYDVALKYNMMPDVIRLEMEDDKKNRPDLYKHKWLGEPLELSESRIYKNWNFIDEIPYEARLERYGLDFGWIPDMSALVAIYYYNGGYILDEVRCQLEWSNREIAETIKNLPQALTVADSAEPKSIAEIKMYGVNIIGAKKFPDSLRQGIKIVQDLKISVTRRSLNVINGYKSWLWKLDKNGNILAGIPEHEPDPLAGARYALETLAVVHRKQEMMPKMMNAPRERSNVGL